MQKPHSGPEITIEFDWQRTEWYSWPEISHVKHITNVVDWAPTDFVKQKYTLI